MKILRFTEEFSRLVIRYTKAPTPNDNLSEDAPLTEHEVANAVRNVLSAILGRNETSDDNTSLRTPVGGIGVITPTISVNQEYNDPNACSSLDAQAAVGGFGSSQTNEDESNNLKILPDGKKFMSRSSPAICVSTVGRSDTFVRKENHNKAPSNQDLSDDVFVNAEIDDNFPRLLSEVRESAMNIVAKLDDFKKQSQPRLKSVQRRLSSGLGRTSATRLMMPTKMCRSITVFGGTPTSSKSLATDKEGTLDRRKSTSGIVYGIATSRKLSESTKVAQSTLNSSLSTCNKSPGLTTRPAKNPKYAHVQSTIPKPITAKRKA